MIAIAPPPAVHGWADTLEYVLPKVWNESQNHVTFTSMDCHRGGTQNGDSVYVCKAEYRVNATGRRELWRIVVTGYGQVNDSKRLS